MSAVTGALRSPWGSQRRGQLGPGPAAWLTRRRSHGNTHCYPRPERGRAAALRGARVGAGGLCPRSLPGTPARARPRSPGPGGPHGGAAGRPCRREAAGAGACGGCRPSRLTNPSGPKGEGNTPLIATSSIRDSVNRFLLICTVLIAAAVVTVTVSLLAL